MSEERIPVVDDDVIDPEEMFIRVELEDGSFEEFQIMKIFEVGGQDYIAVCPVDGGEDVYFYRHFEDEEGNPSIDNIETDEEFEAVIDRFDEILDEEEFDEMG
ncbi:MAG: DUF1292 domain-containing protein [Clostridiales bacterium]|nr:DUF1292 domain-containing protein [Clostridiales bacterium]